MNLYDNNKKLIGIVNYKICKLFFVRKKGNSYVITTKKFSGVKTIKKIKSKTPFSLKINIFCKEGRMKLIAIKDKKIIILAENQNTDVNLLSGVYKLRIVGDNASGEYVIMPNFTIWP